MILGENKDPKETELGEFNSFKEGIEFVQYKKGAGVGDSIKVELLFFNWEEEEDVSEEKWDSTEDSSSLISTSISSWNGVVFRVFGWKNLIGKEGSFVVWFNDCLWEENSWT